MSEARPSSNNQGVCQLDVTGQQEGTHYLQACIRKLSGSGKRRFARFRRRGYSFEEAYKLAYRPLKPAPPPSRNGIRGRVPERIPVQREARSPQQPSGDLEAGSPGLVCQPTTCSTVQGVIKVGIVSEGYPRTRLDKKQLAVVEKALGNVLFGVTARADGPPPRFNGLAVKNGCLVLNCVDAATEAIVRRVTPELQPWEGARLRVLGEADLPRTRYAVAYFPNSASCKSKQLINLLFRQNPEPDLEVKSWSIFSRANLDDTAAVTVGMNQKSAQALESRGCSMFYMLSKINVRLLPGTSSGPESCLKHETTMKSKVDTSWDVMKYKYHYELEHQWDLKKRFIDAHKSKYPEDRLVCLAQLFCNVHFMGCSYEDNIMKLIRELSEGIAEKNQKWEKQSFVTASNAVEARVKGKLGSYEPPSIEFPLSQIEPIPSNSFESCRIKTEPTAGTNDTGATFSVQFKEEPCPKEDTRFPSGCLPSASSFKGGTTEKFEIEKDLDLKEENPHFPSGSDERSIENRVDHCESPTGEENPVDMETELCASVCDIPSLPPLSYRRVNHSKFLQFIQGVIHSDKRAPDKFWGDRSNENYAALGTGHVYSRVHEERRAKRKLEYENARKLRKERKEESKKRRIGGPLNLDDHMERRKIDLSLNDRELSHLLETVVSRVRHRIVAIFRIDSDNENPLRILSNTCQMAHVNLGFSFDPKKPTNAEPVKCRITIDGMFLSSAEGSGRKTAKEAACRLAIDQLKETSFTIVVKAAFVRDGAEVDRDLNLPTSTQSQPAASVDKSMLDSNIGNRMLKLMGWSGGGLGKDSQGIQEPVTASGTVDRKGLGLNVGADFSRKIDKLLQDYIANADSKEMVFASDFTKEERKTIHEVCRKYNLKTKSFGNEPNRQLVVSKKVKPLEIVADLLKANWETEKYKLIPPKFFLDRFTV